MDGQMDQNVTGQREIQTDGQSDGQTHGRRKVRWKLAESRMDRRTDNAQIVRWTDGQTKEVREADRHTERREHQLGQP